MSAEPSGAGGQGGLDGPSSLRLEPPCRCLQSQRGVRTRISLSAAFHLFNQPWCAHGTNSKGRGGDCGELRDPCGQSPSLLLGAMTRGCLTMEPSRDSLYVYAGGLFMYVCV